MSWRSAVNCPFLCLAALGLWPIQRPPGSRPKSVRTCQGLRPRRVRQALAVTHLSALSSVEVNNVGIQVDNRSRLNGGPIRSPTGASPTPSRAPVHGSGATWIANPSSQWTFSTYFLPVSQRTTHVTARWIARPSNGALCHRSVSCPPNRSSATKSIDNSLGGRFLHCW